MRESQAKKDLKPLDRKKTHSQTKDAQNAGFEKDPLPEQTEYI